MTDERASLLASIAVATRDYRLGEIVPPSSAHVDQWLQQFDGAVQLPLVRELNHVLERTYLSCARVKVYLQSLLRSAALVGHDPVAFWRSVNFLNLQAPGRSQEAMLALFDELLELEFGLSIVECGKASSTFLYLDDGVFSGNQISRNLSAWITSECPTQATVHVACLALHLGGEWNAIRPGGYINQAQTNTGKQVDLGWWPEIRIENRMYWLNSCDVLAPTSLPEDTRVQEYAASLGCTVTFRTGQSTGGLGLFSSPEGRELLEQELLKAGVRVRDVAPNLQDYHRPLGNTVFQNSLGFGSMIVTHRNCPNNAPLALWAGNPWYPLFPRRTN